jgi:membrane protease YdiL (CAAX protease family)
MHSAREISKDSCSRSTNRRNKERLQMKKFLSKLFRWHPSRETLIAAIAGLVVIGLSAAMIPTRHCPWVSILIRDIGQIFLLGILFPLVYILRSDNRFAAFGFTLKRWYVFLPINLVLGVLLLLMFLSESPIPTDFHVTTAVVWKAAFVIVAVFFELIFFYGFLRTLFEKAFGIVPGIILTALFYSFHHIGFQPEYGKLIFVGLLFALVYRLGNSALLLYPFFMGVGGTYDVLIQSQAVSPIHYPEIRTVYLFVLILATVLWTWKKAATSVRAR